MIKSVICSLNYRFVRSSVCYFVHSFLMLLDRSFVHLFILSLLRPFSLSFNTWSGCRHISLKLFIHKCYSNHEKKGKWLRVFSWNGYIIRQLVRINRVVLRITYLYLHFLHLVTFLQNIYPIKQVFLSHIHIHSSLLYQSYI